MAMSPRFLELAICLTWLAFGFPSTPAGVAPGHDDLPRLQQTKPDNASQTPRPVASPGSGRRIVVVPRIDVLSPPPFWANGSPLVIRISLEAVSGNEKRIFKAPNEIAFRLAPANVSFNPASVKILRGEDHSELATLTSSQSGIRDLTCTPEGEYPGLEITQSQPVKVDFLAPIDRVGLEPVTGSSTVNVGAQFLVYLYNHNDASTHLIPAAPVAVQLTSQSENGTLAEPVVELTSQQFSKYVRYVGTKMGRDTIVARAHYGDHDIEGQSARIVVFPWWTFIAGLIGILAGSVLRTVVGKPESRRQNFLESFAFGIAFCLLVIVFPIGTKLPQITTFLQPTLAFALLLFVSGLGTDFLKGLLSFVPSRN